MAKLGIVIFGSSLDDLVQVTKRAEDAGLDSAWTTEFYTRSATISLAATALATDRITVGSAIAYAVGRSPLVLATEARDLDELAGGRLILGLGSGTKRMQQDWHGIDFSTPAARIEELVPLLRRLWEMDDEGVFHEGRFYRMALKPTAAVRPPVRIPVYLAGVRERMLQAAGAVADGQIGHPLFTRRYIDEVVKPAIAAGAERTGRASSDVTRAGYLICAIHERSEVARREAKAQLAFYSIVRTYDSIMAMHGWTSHTAAMREAWGRDDIEAMIAAVPDEMLDELAIAGTEDEVLDRFHADFADRHDHVLLYPPSYGIEAGRFAENANAIIDTFAGARAGAATA
jgi:probable F420-dependent oxidoreductase